MKEEKGFLANFKKIGGMDLWMYAVCAILIGATVATGSMSNDLMAYIAICLAVSLLLHCIGKVLPIWNTYIGGGLLMVFFGAAIIKQFGLMPENYITMINDVTNESTNTLTVFIVFLIMGSILSLDRGVLLRSFGGYIPAILGGLVGAAIAGAGVGLIFGVSPVDALIRYVLPIMGGGNGAGAVPLSQVYEQVTGKPAAEYYSFAIIILTIANLMCIVAGGLLNRLGKARPELTGDGTNIMKVDQKLIKEDVTADITMDDILGTLLLGGACYGVGRLFSKVLLPTVLGAQIHSFAYTILFVVIIAALGIVPKNIRVTAKKIQEFMTAVVAMMTMVGLGFDFNLGELVAACSPGNIAIAFCVVIGAIIGSALVGKVVGFYPIDSAVTAGLCMANRGGAGDIAVLTAADRMGLISYAQLSSRIGGGIVLIIASFAFSILLK